MMMVFWILAALMTLAALAFVLVPLLRARAAAAGRSAAEANLDVLRGQRRELEADVALGTLPADAREEAMAELVERARDDLAHAERAATPSAGKPWPLAAAIALAIPLIAFGTYLALGSPAANDARAVASEGKVDDPQFVSMVENLARKVRERPDDAKGWALLARSMAALGRFKESAQAYEQLARLAPGDPEVLADYADALGMAQGRTLAGRPMELVKQALAIDPKHRKSLALAGTAALDANDYAGAIGYWEALATQLPTGSEEESEVRNILADTRQRAAALGQSPPAPRATASAAAAPPKTVSGSVSIAPEVASRVSGSETLFVFARAAQGSRMPLAILRGSARELPMTFALDDTMAMTPATRLSLADAVRIEARISRSGQAAPQPGDLVGTSEVVKPGARGVKIVVDKVVP